MVFLIFPINLVQKSQHELDQIIALDAYIDRGVLKLPICTLGKYLNTICIQSVLYPKVAEFILFGDPSVSRIRQLESEI